MKVVAGNSNRALAEAIAAYLATPLTKAVVRRFADMEIFVEIQDNVRGQDTFIVQSTSFPANDHLMEVLIMTDALRRSSARRITAVIPYFGYARQDRRSGSRTPISAKLVANLITTAGADRVVTVDLHAARVSQGVWEIAVYDQSMASAGAFPYSAPPLLVLHAGVDVVQAQFAAASMLAGALAPRAESAAASFARRPALWAGLTLVAILAAFGLAFVANPLAGLSVGVAALLVLRRVDRNARERGGD